MLNNDKKKRLNDDDETRSRKHQSHLRHVKTKICDGCGYEFDEDCLTRIGGSWYCEACLDEAAEDDDDLK